MKKITFILVALLACISVSAKEKVNLSCLKGQRMMNVEFDWSKVTIVGMEVEDWIAYRQVEEPSEDAGDYFENKLKPQTGEMVKTANKILEKVPLTLISKEGCEYTLRITPMAVDKKNNNTLKCTVLVTETQTVVGEFEISGEAGHWGSMPNLWSDAFKDAGEKLGKLIKSAIK